MFTARGAARYWQKCQWQLKAGPGSKWKMRVNPPATRLAGNSVATRYNQKEELPSG